MKVRGEEKRWLFLIVEKTISIIKDQESLMEMVLERDIRYISFFYKELLSIQGKYYKENKENV